jgi:hypothetical protein
VIDVNHAGVAKELIRTGRAHEFTEAKPEPQAETSQPQSQPQRRRKAG